MKKVRILILITAVIAGGVLGGCGKAQGALPTSPTFTVMASPTATGSPTSSPVADLPTLKPTALPNSQAISNWSDLYAQDLETGTEVISNDLSTISTDATNSNISSLGTDCQTLLSDVNVLQEIPNFPESAVSTPLSQGLSDIASGAQDCTQGVSAQNTTLITEATTEFDNGANLIEQAVTELGILS